MRECNKLEQYTRGCVCQISQSICKLEVSRICIDSDYHSAILEKSLSTIIILYLKNIPKLRERKNIVLSRDAVKTKNLPL
jgi:hypothetical protein